jgi:hypothetical protein
VMGTAPGGRRMPNGVDFWWDEAANQRNNCWFDNGNVTTDPPAPLMPESCENTSAGVTYGPKLSGELLPCAGSIESDNYDPNTCPWFRTPPRPSESQQQGPQSPLPLASSARVSRRLTAPLSDFCVRSGTTLSCAPFRDRP